MHPHIKFESTKHCHAFCLEMRMHTHECIERQVAASPLFRQTIKEAKTTSKFVFLRRRA